MATRYAPPKKRDPKAKKPGRKKQPKPEPPAAAPAPTTPADAQAQAFMSMTDKQRAFCTEYLRVGDADAACKATYGSTENKSRTLENPKVKAYLSLMVPPLMEKLAVTNEWILAQFVDIASAKDDKGRHTNPPAARCRALENLAEFQRMYPAKEVKHTEDDPLIAALREALDGVPAPTPVAPAHVRTN